jgi:hypothetical protein
MIRRNLKIPEIAQFSTARILNFETPSFGIAPSSPRVGELASLPWDGMRVSLNPERVPPLTLQTCVIQNEHPANIETLPRTCESSFNKSY